MAMGASLPADELVDLVLAKLADAVDADRAMLYLLDGEGEHLRGRVLDEQGRLRTIDLPVGRGLAGEAVKSGAPVVGDDEVLDRVEGVRTVGRGARSSIATPLTRHDGEVVGAVQLFKKRGKKPFDEEARGVLAALATQVAVALENAFLVDSLRRQAEELAEAKSALERQLADRETLLHLEHAMARATSTEALVRVTLEQAMRSLKSELAALALEDDELGQHVLWVLRSPDGALDSFDLRPGQGIIGSIVAANATIVANRANDPRSDPSLDEIVGVRTRNALGAPLEGSDETRCLGALVVYNTVGRPAFDRQDIALIELLTANASTAIRLRLAHDGQERENRLAAIGGLLSGVLHDMRTPLAVVRGNLDLLVGEETEDGRRDRAKKAKLQLDALGRMEADVLSFVRGEASVLVRKVYLDAFVSKLRENVAPWLERRRIRFTVISTEHGTHRFDEAKIERVLQNLVKNAAEAIGAREGAITLRVTRDAAGAIVFAVADDGPGIPPEVRARLFGTFVSSGKAGGTGLGLAMAKRFVDEHRGLIDFETGPTGTTFRVLLPAPDPSMPGLPSLPPP
jgi:signal transduction histidine kinase/putative methionine-R-sulfoxide reductase with GAF domain